MAINIFNVEWEKAPYGFDQSGTLFGTQLANFDDVELIIGLDVDKGKASIAMTVDGRGWYDTSSTKDWPEFDKLYGRENWQKFLSEWEQDALEELGDED